MTKAIFTIVSNNYLYYARTLMQGVATQHPECDRFCVLVDNDPSHAAAYPDEFRVIRLEQLALPEPQQFIFRYTILELNTAVKPWAFAHLLDLGYSEVVYLDPDIRLYRPMTEVFALLAGEADIVITPHLLAPMTDTKHPTELDIRRAGTYNFGFCALASGTSTRDFLSWWQAKLVHGCVVDLAAGVFVDQSWIDLVPGMFPRVSILRHAGYNVAYWNLAQRSIESLPTGDLVEGVPLVFFHFSGFDAEEPARFSKHQNRYTLDTLGDAKALAVDYANTLIENGARTVRKIPYGYGTFTDGETVIPDEFRRAYRNDDELAALMGDDPFASPAILWTVTPPAKPGHLAPTYLMQALWNERLDLRRAFAMTDDDSVARFYDWFAGGGYRCSAAVQEAHAVIHASVVQMFATAGPNERSAGGDQFVDHIFTTLLGRLPDITAREHYGQLLASRRLWRVFLSIGLSRESRARPDLIGRLRRGVQEAIGAWAYGFREVAVAPQVVATQGRRELVAPRGWFVQDGDIADSGIWVAPDACLPWSASTDSDLLVEGHYHAELVERQCGSRLSELTVSWGSDVIATKTLQESGPFSLRAVIPAVAGNRLAELRLQASQYFVPKSIGLNDDRRQLAWRATRVTLGKDLLLDSARTPPIMALDATAKIDGVNLVGYLVAESGVGESVRGFALGCHAVGLRCGAFDVGYQNLNRQTDRSMDRLPIEDRAFDINILHVNADQTQTTLAALPAAYRSAAVNIAYWHWEQPALPMSALEAFQGLTEVWVPSGFVRDAVALLSPIPVFKVPHVIEFQTDAAPDRARFGLPEDRFLVLTMYDFDSYQYRKNPQAAIEAYRRACGERTDTALVIKTINADRHPEGHRELLAAVEGIDDVHFIDHYLSRADVHALEQACDCFISLHRSEGFGLGLAEMMYLGKPVVGTGWSGNMEFMTPMNSFPIEYELKPLEKRLGAYEAGQLWAEADIDHAAHVLRRLADDPALRQRIGDAAAASMRRDHSATRIGERYIQRLRLIARRHL